LAADATKLVYQRRISDLAKQIEALAFSCEYLADRLAELLHLNVDAIAEDVKREWSLESAKRSS